MAPMTAARARAELLLDERGQIEAKREALFNDANNRADSNLQEHEQTTLAGYRTRVEQIDTELQGLAEMLEREEKAAEASKNLRGHLVGHVAGVENDGGQIVYRSFAAYARDKLIADIPEVRDHVERELGSAFVADAKERLMRGQLLRAPEATKSSDVGGLLPPTHISQIMDVIDPSRPVVVSGNRVDLTTGSLTWPKVTQRPYVKPQTAEKTENNSRKMSVEMKSDSADTYLGAGNLSWQAVNWSVPNALDLFFQLCAEQYAIQTEAAACHVLAKAAATINSGSLTLDGTDDFEDWITAIMDGFSQVYTATRATSNTIWMSIDSFVLAAAITSASNTKLVDTGALNLPGLSGRIAGLNVVASAGFEEKTVIVGDSRALLVGETPGAPVQLRVVEPSIAGYEVGVVGAFKAISFDDSRFADIGAAT